MKTRRGLWSSLGTVGGNAAVLADWRIILGTEFDRTLPFLSATPEEGDSYPCTDRFPCYCRHEVVVHSPDNIVAACRCEQGDCRAIRLEPKDLVVYAVNLPKLGEAIRRALGFDCANGTGQSYGRQTMRVGTHGPGRIPVLFHTPFDRDTLLNELESILAALAGPFILATPTASFYTATMEQVQHRHGFLLLPLSGTLALEAGGQLRLVQPIDAVLAEFTKRLAQGRGLEKTVERIDRNIDAVAKGTYELRKENEELRRLQADGFFKFSLRVDGADFHAFAVIMALGTRKAAADYLKVPHRSFYDRVDKWPARGRDYQRMFRLVEWRKTSGRTMKVRLEDSLQSGEPDEAAENPETIEAVLTKMKEGDSRSYPDILREILEALMNQHPGNWQAVRDEVVGIITDEIPQ